MSANIPVIVSFIIPHMGREQMLADTLQSIAQQAFDLSTVEVIVVSKNERLSDSIAAIGAAFSLQVLHADKDLTISHQRNIGANIARGEYFAFLDADISLAPNWTSAMLSLLAEQPTRKLVSAVQKNSQHAPPLEQLRTALSNAAVDCEVEFLPGRNLLLQRDTFKASGGFPEHLITCEDYVFTQRIAKLGTLFYSTRSHYIHLGEDKDFWLMADKEVWRGQSNLASLAGRKIPLQEWPSFIAPPLFTISSIIALLCALIGASKLATLSLIIALVVLLMYTLRLRRISKGRPGVFTIVRFYMLYFPARTWGTVKGMLPRN